MKLNRMVHINIEGMLLYTNLAKGVHALAETKKKGISCRVALYDRCYIGVRETHQHSPLKKKLH